jgi:translation initiation factor IF-2
VVCILGHVDHGKTSLLDAIRKANVAAGEAGGITQHIGAYQIEFNSRKITFLDTPGHAAFTKMRARGASVTDIAVLVVAADDGFMPQTDEALKHAQNAKVALMVAVNKMDVKGANLDQVKTQMQQRQHRARKTGVGRPITVPVAAIKGQGINELLDMILLQADVLELQGQSEGEASGVIIESQMDFGRGPLATIIVQRGTLRVGDAIVCGPHFAKVRAMFDDQGKNLKEAPPAMPVRVIGWSGSPDSAAPVSRSSKRPRGREARRGGASSASRRPPRPPMRCRRKSRSSSCSPTSPPRRPRCSRSSSRPTCSAPPRRVRNVLEGIKSAKVSLEIVATEVGVVTKNDVLMAGARARSSLASTPSSRTESPRSPSITECASRAFDIIYELGDKVKRDDGRPA